jgi:flavin-binding protein dodecin
VRAHAPEFAIARVAWGDHLRRFAIGVGILVIEPSKELSGCPRLPLRCRPIDLIGSLAAITTGVRLHDACINGEALALDQTSVYAGPHHCLKRMAQDVAIAESTVAIDRERRMVRHLVVEIEPVGVSEKSWEEAGRNAVETAAGSLRDLRVAEVFDARAPTVLRTSHMFGGSRCEQLLIT